MANMEMIKFQGEMVAALQVVLMVAVMVVEVIMVMGVAVFLGIVMVFVVMVIVVFGGYGDGSCSGYGSCSVGC